MQIFSDTLSHLHLLQTLWNGHYHLPTAVPAMTNKKQMMETQVGTIFLIPNARHSSLCHKCDLAFSIAGCISKSQNLLLRKNIRKKQIKNFPACSFRQCKNNCFFLRKESVIDMCIRAAVQRGSSLSISWQ